MDMGLKESALLHRRAGWSLCGCVFVGWLGFLFEASYLDLKLM